MELLAGLNAIFSLVNVADVLQEIVSHAKVEVILIHSIHIQTWDTSDPCCLSCQCSVVLCLQSIIAIGVTFKRTPVQTVIFGALL